MVFRVHVLICYCLILCLVLLLHLFALMQTNLLLIAEKAGVTRARERESWRAARIREQLIFFASYPSPSPLTLSNRALPRMSMTSGFVLTVGLE